MHSDVFNEFIKIAAEKNLIDSDDTKKQLEKNPRMDSVTLSDMESLYNVTPDSIYKYKNNISEVAHPDPVVISPSYDKLNGLIENINERHNIMLNIVNRNTNAQLINHKYAQKQLLLSLVRIGNHLDNINNDELRKLADTSLTQLSDNINKQAAGPAVAAGAAGSALALGLGAKVAIIAAVLGAVWLYQHMDDVNEGFEENHKRLVEQIDDLLKEHVSWGFGYQFTQEFILEVHKLKDVVLKIHDAYTKVFSIIKAVDKARTGKELMELSLSDDGKTIINAKKYFEKILSDYIPYLIDIEYNFKNEGYKLRQIVDKGWIQNLIDKTQFLHGGKGLFVDQFDDVVLALAPYKKSIKELKDIWEGGKAFKERATNDLTRAVGVAESEYGVSMSTPTPSSDKKMQSEQEEWKKLDEEFGKFTGL